MAFGAGLEQLFHFSCLNYGDYCLCFNIYFYFLLPVAWGNGGEKERIPEAKAPWVGSWPDSESATAGPSTARLRRSAQQG
jgi:hypothetical protein